MDEAFEGRVFTFVGDAASLRIVLGGLAFALVAVLAGPTWMQSTLGAPVEEAVDVPVIDSGVPYALASEACAGEGIPKGCPVRPWPLNELVRPTDVSRVGQVLMPALGKPLPHLSDVPMSQLSRLTLGSCSGRRAAHCLRPNGLPDGTGGLSQAEWQALWLVWMGSAPAPQIYREGHPGYIQYEPGRLAVRQYLGVRRDNGQEDPSVQAVQAAIVDYPRIYERRFAAAREVAVQQAKQLAQWRAARAQHERAMHRHERRVRRLGRVRFFGATAVVGLIVLALAVLVRRRRAVELRVEANHLVMDGQRWPWRDVVNVVATDDRIEVHTRDGGVTRSKPLSLDERVYELISEVRAMLVPPDVAAEEEDGVRRLREAQGRFERA